MGGGLGDRVGDQSGEGPCPPLPWPFLAWEGAQWWAGSEVTVESILPRGLWDVHPPQVSHSWVWGNSCHTHLPVCHVLSALARGAGPPLVPGPGSVVLPLLGIALLVRGWGVVVVVVVMVLPVLPVLGPAPLLVPLLRWQVPGLGGHA